MTIFIFCWLRLIRIMEQKKKILSRIITAVEVEALMREGKNEEAYNELNSILKENPDDAYSWYLLGCIYKRQQLWREALVAFNKAKLIEPDGPAAAAFDAVYEILYLL